MTRKLRHGTTFRQIRLKTAAKLHSKFSGGSSAEAAECDRHVAKRFEREPWWVMPPVMDMSDTCDCVNSSAVSAEKFPFKVVKGVVNCPTLE